ncbi:hypothetical protein JCM19233_3389 [Vibrio astriarenae]|nr:hypothetical protein JCM19233_3389 [Vibrio sp. C7]
MNEAIGGRGLMGLPPPSLPLRRGRDWLGEGGGFMRLTQVYAVNSSLVTY